VKPVLVTGATGFVGWHVARKLVQRGYKVRALVRDPSRLRELVEVEPVTGDLRDPESLSRALAGCSLAYHVAADYRLWARYPRELFDSNVTGTRNVLEQARLAGVERVVYTSTVGCIGVPPGDIGTERDPISADDMKGAYKQSKFQAEQIALQFAGTGFPVVIVNPTAPIGDHDFRPTPTGRIVLDFLKGKMPAYVDTGLNVVNARDTAEGHLLACERGKSGERYILGGENLTLQSILEKLARISGLKAPTLQIPYAVALGAGVVSTALAYVTGKEPIAPLDAVRMSRKKMWVSHQKAATELGYTPGPSDAALEQAVRWFRANGYV